MEKFASANFFNEFSFGATRGPEMLVKYANFVKIQPIAPDKRVRPKASNLLVDLCHVMLGHVMLYNMGYVI